MAILLVGDDLVLREAVASALRSLRYPIVSATTGIDAINQALLAAPSLVVVLGGARSWETVEQLKSRLHTKAVPLICGCPLTPAQEAAAQGYGVVMIAAGDRERLLETIRRLCDAP
jgi:CheY-like chemotaxis protein